MKRRRILLSLLAAIGLMLIITGCDFYQSKSESTSSSDSTAAPSAETPPASATRVTGIPSTPASRQPRTAGTAPKPRTADSSVSVTTLDVSGRITAPDGTPLVGATVKLVPISAVIFTKLASEEPAAITATATTDAEGRYHLSGAAAINNCLTINSDYPLHVVAVQLEQGYNELYPRVHSVTENIALPAVHPAAGQVLSINGAPLADVAVHLLPTYHYVRSDTRRRMPVLPDHNYAITTTSTAEGRFNVPHLYEGQWTAVARVPGFAPVRTVFDVPTTSDITLKFDSRGGTILGSVYDKHTGNAVPDVPLRLHETGHGMVTAIHAPQTTSSVDGTFRFDHLSTGSFYVSISAQDNPQWALAAPPPGELLVSEGQQTEATIFVHDGLRLTGHVFDSDTSEPLSGAIIRVAEVRSSSRPGMTNHTAMVEGKTDAQGNFALDGILPQNGPSGSSLFAEVELPGYLIASSRSMAFAIQQSNMQVPLRFPAEAETHHLELPMVPSVTISGRVVNESRVAVPHAYLTLRSQHDSIVSMRTPPQATPVNDDGTFELVVPPLNTYELVAAARGYAPTTLPKVEVLNKPIADLEIVLDPGITVAGSVVDDEGAPVAGARVIAYSGGRSSIAQPIAVSNAQGQFLAHNISRDMIRATANHDGYIRFRGALPEIPKDGQPMKLVLEKAYTIAGVVVDQSGAPVLQFPLSIEDGSNGMGVEYTQEGGKFKFQRLRKGAYNIVTRDPADRSVPVTVLVPEVPTGTEDVRIVVTPPEKKTDDETEQEIDDLEPVIAKVQDEATGEPVKDFTVHSTRNLEAEKLPEPGKLRLTYKQDNRPASTYRSPGQKPDYSGSLQIGGGDYLDGSFSVTFSGEHKNLSPTFVLKKAAAITGRVIDEDDKPVPGIVVILINNMSRYSATLPTNTTRKSVETDSEGRFTFAPVSPMQSVLMIKPGAGYMDITQDVRDIKSDSVKDVGDIKLSAGGTITVKVLNANKQPMPGQKIVLRGGSESGEELTDETGTVVFRHLPAQNYQVLHVTKSGERQQHQNLQVQQEVEILFQAGNARVHGSITYNGQPVTGSVSLSHKESRQSGSGTIEDGQYEIAGVVPGPSMIGYFTSNGQGNENIEIPEQGDLRHDIVIRDKEITIKVIDDNGAPVPYARLTLTNNYSQSGALPLRTQADAAGQCTLSIPPASYQVEIVSQDNVAASGYLSTASDKTEFELKYRPRD